MQELAKNQMGGARINSLHSYNVFDHPDYLASKITEEKFARFTKANNTDK
jgi:hypothetical protein